MKSLKGTKTAENLMKAFAGESQAKNRYSYYASVAKKEGYVQIANIFLETSENEGAHAKRFLKFLVEDLNGEAVEINGAAYPAALGDTKFNLKAAAEGENEEWTTLYPSFAATAEEEGFPAVAAAFKLISKVETAHEKRYNKLLENLEKEEVFKKQASTFWKCLNCGYIYEGTEAPKTCPACLHPQAYFELLSENY
ncbi:rubrerythrin family protein [Clostridium sp. 19966]|uniref:rubrerythrin n=1 Tax=Clostridium sp. 19966 TaxID=2768166 RepID=UPI0028DF71A9|nr:rubrerythrin family protein [Clostridium sp. 19966]MDT8719423.1 rubrerythrin family protein [Clostridium sp. 19966]